MLTLGYFKSNCCATRLALFYILIFGRWSTSKIAFKESKEGFSSTSILCLPTFREHWQLLIFICFDVLLKCLSELYFTPVIFFSGNEVITDEIIKNFSIVCVYIYSRSFLQCSQNKLTLKKLLFDVNIVG